jgi:hypothetical protein
MATSRRKKEMKIGTPNRARFSAGVQLNAPTYRTDDRRFTSETLMATSRRNPPNKMAGRQEDENQPGNDLSA